MSVIKLKSTSQPYSTVFTVFCRYSNCWPKRQNQLLYRILLELQQNAVVSREFARAMLAEYLDEHAVRLKRKTGISPVKFEKDLLRNADLFRRVRESYGEPPDCNSDNDDM